MTVDEEGDTLPEAKSAPLVIDVEFTEVEEESTAPSLDAVEEISVARARRPRARPEAPPPPAGPRLMLLYLWCD